ncbi:uncharacterized protein MONBRDRAFT_3675, partial [Monosiga brevicollis MX1]
MPAALASGYLVKEGAKVRNWKRRWFTLDRHGVLRYFRDEAASKSLGTLDL